MFSQFVNWSIGVLLFRYTARVVKSVPVGLRVEFIDDRTTAVLPESEISARVRMRQKGAAPQRHGDDGGGGEGSRAEETLAVAAAAIVKNRLVLSSCAATKFGSGNNVKAISHGYKIF